MRQAEEGNPEGGNGSVVVGGGWGTGITKGLKRSFWGDTHVLDLDRGGGCTTLKIYSVSLDHTLR